MQIELDGRGSLHGQIERAIRRSILDGRLPPGQRLPSSRDLANLLDVSRPVVQLAYRQLCVEGYARARVGSGTYVEESLPERHLRASVRRPGRKEGDDVPTDPRPELSAVGKRLASVDLRSPPRLDTRTEPTRVDFRYGPPTSDATTLAAWKRVLRRCAGELGSADLDLSNPSGFLPLREQLATHLRIHRAVRCTARQIVVTAGTQQALELVTRLLVDPGDRVAIENPHYVGARDAFAAAGADLLAIEVDQEGLIPGPILDSGVPVVLLYLTPSHQFPTGATMSAARRLQLLQGLAGTNTLLVEDDYDGEFRYDAAPLPSIQGQASERVVYVGSFSKVLFPALRLGYAVLPEWLLEPFRRAKWVADCQCPVLEQMTLARFIDEGHFARHLRRSRQQLKQGRDALVTAVDEKLGARVSLLGHEAGMHVLLRLPELDTSEVDGLIRRAAARGVRVRSSAPYYVGAPDSAELVLGYGGLTRTAIRHGIARLAEALEG